MESDIIIKGSINLKRKNRIKKICLSVFFVCLLLGIIFIVISITRYNNPDNWYYSYTTDYMGFKFPHHSAYEEIDEMTTTFIAVGSAGIGICFLLYFIFLSVLIQKNEIIVGKTKISGQTRFGHIVDLPIDKISAVAISKPLSAVSVATSSGSIRFFLLSNYKEVYDEISNLLQTRQTQPKEKNKTQVDNSQVEEIKKYKELLDNGIITQAEFDEKKKQLLGL